MENMEGVMKTTDSDLKDGDILLWEKRSLKVILKGVKKTREWLLEKIQFLSCLSD